MDELNSFSIISFKTEEAVEVEHLLARDPCLLLKLGTPQSVNGTKGQVTNSGPLKCEYFSLAN